MAGWTGRGYAGMAQVRYIRSANDAEPSTLGIQAVISCMPPPIFFRGLGRLDDCFRTNAGHLMNPAAVGAALETYPGVTDVAAVPLPTAKGPVLGVLVQGVEALRVGDLRRHLARALPAWAQPSVLETTDALPRLPSGKMDRRACIESLKKTLPPEDA